MPTSQDLVSLIGPVTGVAALAVSILAYRKSSERERRDQEAIITIEPLWQGRKPNAGIDPNDATNPTWNSEPYPHEPHEKWVITNEDGYDAGILVRPSNDADERDGDRQQYATWRILVAISNYGRAAATNVRLRLITDVTLMRRAFEETETVNRVVEIECGAIPLDGPRYVEIRNMTGLPATIIVSGLTAGADAKQPVRLIESKPLVFFGRG